MRTRNKNGVKQHIIKWRGCDETFNFLLNATDIKKSNRSFYVTLPSPNSDYYFAVNTMPDFRTKLATPLELEHGRWEVRLEDISYPKG